MNSLKDKSVAYWQDRLSKFFPTSPGPTYTESDMFIAGYHQALIDQAEQSKTELGNNVEKAAEDYINNQFVDSWPHGNDPEMAFIAGAKWYKNCRPD